MADKAHADRIVVGAQGHGGMVSRLLALGPFGTGVQRMSRAAAEAEIAAAENHAAAQGWDSGRFRGAGDG